ncbi:MAG: hypothetical protein LBM75_04530 [Myxococcales bacterium]|jgi:hypothetical protein|nr:hypothetical protein [Myxococcales bacterium]
MKLIKLLLGLVVLAAFLCSGWLLVQKHQQQMGAANIEKFDIPMHLVAIHSNALEGMIELTPPSDQGLGTKLLNAGFPRQRPTLNLVPRATIVGTAVTPIGPHFVSNSLYKMDVDENRRFSIFLVPASDDLDKDPFDPRPMNTMKLAGKDVRAAARDGLNVIVWRKGNWRTGLVTDLNGPELAGLVELIQKAEARL